MYPRAKNSLKMSQKASFSPLQELVKGLPAKEQSYFRRAARFQANRKNTLALRLFELMIGADSYTTDTLCELLHIRSKTQLSGIKTKLFNDILDMKVSIKRKENINSRLHFVREQAIHLMNRSLFESAREWCSRGIILAKHYAKYQYLSELLHLQNNAMQYMDYKRYKAGSYSLLNRIQLAIRHEQALQQIRIFYEQMKILGYRSWLPIEAKEIKEVREMENKVTQMSREPFFMQSMEEEALIKLYFLNTKALCCYMLHEKESCTKICLQIIEHWKASPQLINEYAALFIHSVNITSYTDFYCRQNTLAKEHISTYARLARDHLAAGFYSKIFSVVHFNTELKIYHKTFCYDRVKQIIDQQSSVNLSYAKELLPPPDALSVHTSVYISYFVLEQWDDAEMLLLNVKEQNRTINREDILFFSLIFHLLILYEKKEWYRMDSTIETTYHFLYARKRLRSFERAMLLFLKHLAASRNKEDAKKACSRFLNQLQKTNRNEIPLYSLYFNFPGWVESKIRDMHYMDYMRAQGKNLAAP